MPLTEDVAPLDSPASDEEQFTRLTEATAAWAKEQSRRFPIVYIETDYFGGAGAQAAIAWHGGFVVYGPTQTDGTIPLLDRSINRALRTLGVDRGTSIDEFAALSLDRHRHNDDWITAADQPIK